MEEWEEEGELLRGWREGGIAFIVGLVKLLERRKGSKGNLALSGFIWICQPSQTTSKKKRRKKELINIQVLLAHGCSFKCISSVFFYQILIWKYKLESVEFEVVPTIIWWNNMRKKNHCILLYKLKSMFLLNSKLTFTIKSQVTKWKVKSSKRNYMNNLLEVEISQLYLELTNTNNKKRAIIIKLHSISRSSLHIKISTNRLIKENDVNKIINFSVNHVVKDIF